METDQELLRRLQRRDARAFELLCSRYSGQIRGQLVRIIRDEAASEDLLQEVLLLLWLKAPEDDVRSLSAWLARIATNLAINHLRSVRRRRQQPLIPQLCALDQDDSDSVPGWLADASALGPDEILAQAEEHDLLRRLVSNLSEDRQEMLRMIHAEEMNHAEVAVALGIPPGTVKSRLHYTIKQLARQWKQHLGEKETS